MPTTFTTNEITACGLHRDTVFRHARKNWLRGEKVSDVIGWRFTVKAVQTWADKYLRGDAKKGVLHLVRTGEPPPKAKLDEPLPAKV